MQGLGGRHSVNFDRGFAGEQTIEIKCAPDLADLTAAGFGIAELEQHRLHQPLGQSALLGFVVAIDEFLDQAVDTTE